MGVDAVVALMGVVYCGQDIPTVRECINKYIKNTQYAHWQGKRIYCIFLVENAHLCVFLMYKTADVE